MQSLNEAPINISVWDKLFNVLLKQGLVFVVMAIMTWIFYNWVQENRREDEERRKEDKHEINELRQLVQDCALSKKERMEIKIDGIGVKLDQILNKYEKDN